MACFDPYQPNFIRPSVYYDVKETSKIFTDEVFGPVLVVNTFKDEADALHKANDTECEW